MKKKLKKLKNKKKKNERWTSKQYYTLSTKKTQSEEN